MKILNGVPESVGYTTRGFLCYFLLWIVYTPFLFQRPYQLRDLFTMPCVASFPSVIRLFIYYIASSKGQLGLDKNVGIERTSGSSTAWLVVYTVSSSLSNGAAYIESVPDVTRWAAKPTAVIPPTLFYNML